MNQPHDRKIIHVDMDAFFASVEQRNDPRLQDKPVIVGGRPDSRGVVAAASYEARKFGVRSAMPCAQAYRLCPQAVFLPPRISVYRRVSRVVLGILRSYTDLIEPLSLDEAYLDVTRNKKGILYASNVAKEIRKTISSYTGLTASAGVAPNKFLAKIASDVNKPNGMKVIQPHEVEAFLTPLPIRTIPGVGRVTEEKMLSVGIATIGHLRQRSLTELQAHFGKNGQWFFDVARGIDDRPVTPHRERKSLGSETTFHDDVLDLSYLGEVLQSLTEKISVVLQRKEILAKTVTLKVKYHTFEQISRSRTLEYPIDSQLEISRIAQELLALTDAGRTSIRLVGVSVSSLYPKGSPVCIRGEDAQISLPFGM